MKKPVFDIENYKGVKVAMHCPTEENAYCFLEYLQSIGKKWCDGVEYDGRNTMWYEYKEDTAYAFNEGKYADVNFYFEHNCLVIHFDDFIFPKQNELYKIDSDDSEAFGEFMSDFIIT